MQKKWMILLVVAGLLIVVRIALPFVIKNYVNKTLNNLDGYSGSVEDIDLHLFRGAYIIKNTEIKITGDSVPVPFVSIQKIDLSVHWKALFNGAIVGEVILDEPELNFAVANNPSSGNKKKNGKKVNQDGSGTDWTKPLTELMPLSINRFEIKNGKITFKDFTSEPKVDIFIDNLGLLATNLTNVKNKNKKLPSTLTVQGKSLGSGLLNAKANLNILKDIPDIDLDFKFESVSLPALNSFTKAYTNTDIEEGKLSIYSEIVINNGELNGYVKPILENLKFVEWTKQEGNFLQKTWESIVGGSAELLENQPNDQFATKIPLKGNLNDMDVAVLPTLWNILKNAFIKAFSKQVEDTVKFPSETN